MVPLTSLIAMVCSPAESAVSNNTSLRPVKEAKSIDVAEPPSILTAATPLDASVRRTDLIDPNETGGMSVMAKVEVSDQGHASTIDGRGNVWLADATLAFLGGSVQETTGRIATWQPGLQVTPLSAGLTEYFHSDEYQAACKSASESSRFVVDPVRLEEAREVFKHSLSVSG